MATVADSDQRLRIAALHTVVDRPGERRVQRWSDGSSGAVQLGCKELLEVGLVPRGEQSDGGVARVAAGIAVGECRRKVFEVGGIGRWAVRRLTAVRPSGRSPDRDEDLHPSLLRAANEVVDVVEPVGGIEGIDRVRRTDRSRVLPHDDPPEERGARLASTVEHRRPIRVPSEARVVLQTDEQALGHRVLRRHDRLGPGSAEHEHDADRSDGARDAQQAQDDPHDSQLPAWPEANSRRCAAPRFE